MRTMLKRATFALALAVTVSVPAQGQVLSWDFNSNDGGWTNESVVGSAAWTWSPGFWEIGTSSTIGWARLVSPVATATSFLGWLDIFHSYNFEGNGGNCFDGGVVTYRVNGGAWTPLNFLVGGYNGTLSSSFGNPLGGQEAFCGNGGPFSAALGLVSPGDTYQLAFNATWDVSIDRPAPNWKVTRVDALGFEMDDISTVPEPSTVALLATGLVGMAVAARRRRKQSAD